MSAKRRKRRSRAYAMVTHDKKTQNKSVSTEVARPMPMMAMDAYLNRIAYLGEASDLMEANDFVRNPITRNVEMLSIMYRENWIAKRIIDTPCEDMTRSWYTIASALDQASVDKIVELENAHNVKQEITNGLRWARLYGGAAAIMVIKGQEDCLDEPLDYDDLMPGCFRGLIIVDRSMGLEPSVELEEDMDDQEYNYPKYYDVVLNNNDNSIVRVHHSRMLIFRGRMLPPTEERNESFWGASEFEHIYDELQKRNSTSANIAQMVFQANITTLKMEDYGEVMGMGTETQKARIMQMLFEQNRIKNAFGMQLLSAGDSYEQHAYNFGGLTEVYEQFMMDMAGAAEIPATKLYGRSPQGMNATGESDMKNYYEMLAQLQERHLRPAIVKLLPVMCMSLWGKIPEDMQVVFAPVATTTPTERADIISNFANTIISAYTAGLISQKRALMELVNTGKDVGAWGSITQEFIDKADDEVDQGEMAQDPMAAMMGGGMPGMEASEGGNEEEEEPLDEKGDINKGDLEPRRDTPDKSKGNPKGKPEACSAPQKVKPEEDLDTDEIIYDILTEDDPDEKEEKADDGGPGSGPKPGYHKNGAKKADLVERAKFMANPTEGMSAPRQKRTAESVNRANRERKEWHDLTLHQKVEGNAQQEKHMRSVKSDVRKAVASGDLNKAREIVKKNKHYFMNDPDSAMKVQSETLKRQKAVKPKSGLSRLFGRS